MAIEAASAATYAKRKVRQYHKDQVKGFIEWCRECVRVMGGDSEVSVTTVPFKLWSEQEKFARTLIENKRVVCLKARQLGMTTEVLAFFLFRALYWENNDFLIISINENEAKKSLDRVKLMIDHLPEWTQPELEVSNTQMVKFVHSQSSIRVQASTRNVGRGTTVMGVLLDEDAAQVYSDEIYLAAMPALEKRRGWMIRLSTANGVGNSFHRCWVDAEQGKNGFAPVFINWRADPNRDQKWYEQELERNGREYMSQEFPETSLEAFLASGRPFFDMERVSAHLAGKLPEFRDGFFYGNEFVPMANGIMRVWEMPKVGTRYAWFCDVSEGLESGDWSVAYCKEIGGRAEVARIRGKIDPAELADVLWEAGHFYSYRSKGAYENENEPALLAVESNNHGLVVTSRLRDRGYRRLWYQRDLMQPGAKVTDRVGWLTTAPTRRLMLGKFQANYRTGMAVVRDRECLEEMGNFFHRGQSGKPCAAPGQHDDCVMARAGLEVVEDFEAAPDEKMSIFEIMPGLKRGGAHYWAMQDAKKSEERDREQEEVTEM